MSRHNHLFAALMLGAVYFAARAGAGETYSGASVSTTNHPACEATLRGGETVGDHQIQRVFLDFGTNQIAFMVPNGFCTDASNPQKIVLTDSTSGSFMTVRVGSLNVPAAVSENDFFKAEALKRFPGAKITGESAEIAADHRGSAFNLQWDTSGGTVESARIVFIPCRAGVLEFCVMARTARFKDAQLYLTLLMTSVRSNETGKLVITPVPDFS
jgi:hypothetical protein